jgi:hypothetical protein
LTIVSQNILADSIAAVGLMIAFYYGLTGFACVWYYRKTLTKTPRDFVMRGVIPLLGGLILLGAFLMAAQLHAGKDYGETTLFGIGAVFVLGIGTLLLGVVLMEIWNAMAPAYFNGETLPKGSHDLVLAGEIHELPHLGLPDSHEHTVIAPDLSNLPPGQRAVDPLDPTDPES